MWGFFLMLQAACNSFATLGVLRALAGAAEACSDPSFMLITVMVSLLLANVDRFKVSNLGNSGIPDENSHCELDFGTQPMEPG